MVGGAPITIAVLTKNLTNPAYVGARAGADRVAGEAGGHALHFVPSTPDDVDEQIALIRRAVQQKVDAIVVAPTHPTAVLPAFDEVQAVGMPLITLVSRAEHAHVACHVGSDDVLLSAAITDYLCRYLGGAGRLVYIGGHPNSSTSLDREKGFRRALASWANVVSAVEADGLYQREPAREAMREIIAAMHAAGQSVDGVVAANDFMAIGVLEALDEAGLRLPVVGVNATPDAVAAIRDGRMLATAAFDAMAMACVAAEAAVRLVRGEAVPREIILPVEIVDSRNAGVWDRPYEARRVPTWEEVVG